MDEEIKKTWTDGVEIQENVNVTESLSLIKSTIDKTKYNIKYLLTHLISFGFASLFFNVLIFINTYKENKNLETFAGLGFSICSLILLYFYIQKSKIIRKIQGDYTVQLYSLWGYALFLPPLANTSRFMVASSKVVVCYDLFMAILSFSFLVIAILITGILLKNKIIVAVGIVSPIVASLYVILRLSIGVSFKVNSFAYYAKFTIRQMSVLTIVFTVLYLAFAIFFKVNGEKLNNEENS